MAVLTTGIVQTVRTGAPLSGALQGRAATFRSFLGQQGFRQSIAEGRATALANALADIQGHSGLVSALGIERGTDDIVYLQALAESAGYAQALSDHRNAAGLDEVLGAIRDAGTVDVAAIESALRTTLRPIIGFDRHVDLRPARSTDALHLEAIDRQHMQRQWLQRSGLIDGAAWSNNDRLHDLGGGATASSFSESGPIERVAMASFDAADLIPEQILSQLVNVSQDRFESMLADFFTRRELNEHNLGEARSSIVTGTRSGRKFHSRLAGLLSLKAATFRAAGLPLPSEDGAEGLAWTDIEYVRDPFTTADGGQRYRRVRTLTGQVKARLQGKNLFASFTDHGYTGMAVAVVERERGASGLVSLGFDISDKRDPGHYGSEEHAQAHATAEAAYKATYFGGQRPFYLDAVMHEVHRSSFLAEGRQSVNFTGVTDRAARQLGASEAHVANVSHGDLFGALMILKGNPAQVLSKTGEVAAPMVKPALARMMEDGLINVIYTLPGQASDYIEWLVERYSTSPVAQRIINEEMAALLGAQGQGAEQRRRRRSGKVLDLRKVLRQLLAQIASGKTAAELDLDTNVFLRSEISQPLIGITQGIINAEMAAMGYDLSKATVVIGHSQGQVTGLEAVGALSISELFQFLEDNGVLMAEAGGWWDPAPGDSYNLAAIAALPSGDQLAAMRAYTGKISMLSSLHVSRDDAARLVEEVNQELNPENDPDGESVDLSLPTIQSGEDFTDLQPDGYEPSSGPRGASMVYSGTHRAVIALAQKISELKGAKVRVIPTSAPFHCRIQQRALRRAWPLLLGKQLGPVPTAVLLNHDGSDLRDIPADETVTRHGPVERMDGRTDDIPAGARVEARGDGWVEFSRAYQINARIAAVMEGQYIEIVDWSRVVWSAYNRCDHSKPTVVINGMGTAVSKDIAAILANRHGNVPISIIDFTSPEGEALLRSGSLEGLTSALVDPRTATDPHFQPLAPQVAKGHPFRDPDHTDYTGAHWYQSQVVLADPVKRRELIKRLKRVLNLDRSDDPSLHSEVLGQLGFDPSMPLICAAMTGNNRVELLAAMAAAGYLSFFATSTVNNFPALAAEFDAIHSRTQTLLQEAGDPLWQDGAPFGANIIYGTDFWEGQVQEIVSAVDRGIPIRVVSIAFSEMNLEDWNRWIVPLLERGVSIMPLCENRLRFKLFQETIYPSVDPRYHDLLLLAPEGAEGGGHNVKLTSQSITFTHEMQRLLYEDPLDFPWATTGGQSTPLAMLDTLLVQAKQDRRLGLQIGGILQMASESAPPDQVKRLLCRAAAGEVPVCQIESEYERNINVVRNRFAEAMQRVQPIMDACPYETNEEGRRVYGEAIGVTWAERIVDEFLSEPAESRRLIFGMWERGLNDFNRHLFEHLMQDVWPSLLEGNREALKTALAGLTAPEVIRVLRSYRTWAVMDPDIDPDWAYVLAGWSVRALGESLEAEGRAADAYFNMPVVDMLQDLRQRTIDRALSLLRQATAIEEAEADNFAVLSATHLAGQAGVTLVTDQPLPEDGTGTLRLRLGQDVDAEKWLAALQRSGHGCLTRILRSDEIIGAEKGNPLLRALHPQRGDELELIRRRVHAADGEHIILEALRVFDRHGRLCVKIRPNDDNSAVLETWYMPQREGVEDTPMTVRYELEHNAVGGYEVRLNEAQLVEESYDGYAQQWTGRPIDRERELAAPAAGVHRYDHRSVLTANEMVGATTNLFANEAQDGGVLVHPVALLQAAWPAIMEAGLNPQSGISIPHVIDSGMSFRLAGSLPQSRTIDDQWTSRARIVRIEDTEQGREATIECRVFDSSGALVGEIVQRLMDTRLLSDRVADTAVFEQASELTLLSPGPEIELEPYQVFRVDGLRLSREDFARYELDGQPLHTDSRWARRFGARLGVKDVIAQGRLTFWQVATHVLQSYLGPDVADRFIGFGPGSRPTLPLGPDEEFSIILKRVGLKSDREILHVTIMSDKKGMPLGEGTIEVRLPEYTAVFPGNASQRQGMARDLWEQGGLGRVSLVEGVDAFADDPADTALLLDVLTDGASIPDGEVGEVRRAALAEIGDNGWLADVENSSCAVLASGVALFRKKLADGFPSPSKAAGHSMGQYTAAVASGAIDFQDGMRLVKTRGRLFKQHGQGCMGALVANGMIDPDELQQILNQVRQDGEVLEVTNVNSLSERKSEVAFAGDREAVERAEQRLFDIYTERGLSPEVVIFRDTVIIAYHTSKLHAVEAEFRPVVEAAVKRDPAFPIVSIVIPGQLISTREQLIGELIALNHSNVEWHGAAASFSDGPGCTIEFSPNSHALAKFCRRAMARGSQVNSVYATRHDDEFFFGKRVAAVPAPTPVARPAAQEDPAGIPADPVGSKPASAAPAMPVMSTMPQPVAASTGPPAAYSAVQMAALNTRMTSCLVVKDPRGNVTDVAVSPLAPSADVSVSELLWRNIILAVCESNNDVDPTTLRPDSGLGKDLEFNSLTIATVYGRARTRLGIKAQPDDKKVKALENQGLAQMFEMLVEQWGVEYPGEGTPRLEERGENGGKAGLSYKALLASEGIRGKDLYFEATQGDVKITSAGLDKVEAAAFAEVGEGAGASIEALRQRASGIQVAKQVKKQAANLAAVQEAVLDHLAIRCTELREDREASSAGSVMPMAGMPMMLGAGAGPSREERLAEARAVGIDLLKDQGLWKETLRLGERPLEFDPMTGRVRPLGELERERLQGRLDRISANTSDEFVAMMGHEWGGGLYSWGEADMNGGPRNLLDFTDEIENGLLDPVSEYGQAKVRLLANQIDKQRADQALSFARIARERGQSVLSDALEQVSQEARQSLALYERYQKTDPVRRLLGHLQFEHIDPATGEGRSYLRELAQRVSSACLEHAIALGSFDLTVDSSIEELAVLESDQVPSQLASRVHAALRKLADDLKQMPACLQPKMAWDTRKTGKTPSQYVDHLEQVNAVDAATAGDLRAALRGEIDYTGRRVLVFGGTGNIGYGTVKFFLMLGADVMLSTRRDLRGIENDARDLRNEFGLRHNRLHAVMDYVPNKSNARTLIARLQEGMPAEERQVQRTTGPREAWKPDILVNSMAAEDYGTFEDQGDWYRVSGILFDEFRYFAGRTKAWYEQEPASSPSFTILHQDSPQKEYMIELSHSYVPAKAALGLSYYTQRRDTERVYYKAGSGGQARPMYRVVNVLTGLVVTVKDPADLADASELVSITDAFAAYPQEFEAAAAARDKGLVVFDRETFGPVNVVACNPAHGVADQDRVADGGLGTATEGVDGGFAGLFAEAKAIKSAAEAKVPQEHSAELPFHPFHEGQLTTMTDYSIWVQERDGQHAPAPAIEDDGLYLVAADGMSSYGHTLIDSADNLAMARRTRRDDTGPWASNLGLLSAGRYTGYDVADLSPAEVLARHGREIYAGMGPQLLVRDGVTGDALPFWQETSARDEYELGTLAELAALDDEDMLALTRPFARAGYSFVPGTSTGVDGRSVPVLVAHKDDAELGRRLRRSVAPQVWADLPDGTDFSLMGVHQTIGEMGARNIAIAQATWSGATRMAGDVVGQLRRQFGAPRIRLFSANGTPTAAIQNDMQVSPEKGKSPRLNSIVLGIGAAQGARSVEDQAGGMGGTTDSPYACATPGNTIHLSREAYESLWHTVRILERRMNEAIGWQKQVLRTEYLQALDMARNAIVDSITSEDGATHPTSDSFDAVGAMMPLEAAEKRGFAMDRHQRTLDQDRDGRFQAGVGGGALVWRSGWAVKKYGYRPLAKLGATAITTDGAPVEPDGKSRAWTGIGKYGQRLVMYRVFREMLLNGMSLSDLLLAVAHGTATGGDVVEQQSLMAAAVMATLEMRLRQVAAGSPIYEKFEAYLADRDVNPGDIVASIERALDSGEIDDPGLKEAIQRSNLDYAGFREFAVADAIARRLGFDMHDMTRLCEQVNALDLDLKEELGWDRPAADQQVKGMGYRHMLGGGMFEVAVGVLELHSLLTLPHDYLNNIIPAAGRHPFLTTHPNATDLTKIPGVDRRDYTYVPRPRAFIMKQAGALVDRCASWAQDTFSEEAVVQRWTQIAEKVNEMRALSAGDSDSFDSHTFDGMWTGLEQLLSEEIKRLGQSHPHESHLLVHVQELLGQLYERHRTGMMWRQFGFNGINAAGVMEKVPIMVFDTLAAAQEWTAAGIRREARAIANHRAVRHGEQPAIQYLRHTGVEADHYADTHAGVEQAEALARRIVDREADVTLPWHHSPEWKKPEPYVYYTEEGDTGTPHFTIYRANTNDHWQVVLGHNSGGFPTRTQGGFMGEIGRQVAMRALGDALSDPSRCEVDWVLLAGIEPGSAVRAEVAISQLVEEVERRGESIELERQQAVVTLKSAKGTELARITVRELDAHKQGHRPSKKNGPAPWSQVSELEGSQDGTFKCIDTCVTMGREPGRDEVDSKAHNPHGYHLTARYRMRSSGEIRMMWARLDNIQGNLNAAMKVAADELMWWMGAAVAGSPGVTTDLHFETYAEPSATSTYLVVVGRATGEGRVPAYVVDEASGQVIARGMGTFHADEAVARQAMGVDWDSMSSAWQAFLENLEGTRTRRRPQVE